MGDDMEMAGSSDVVETSGSVHTGGAPSIVVELSSLQALQSRPGLIEYCRQLWGGGEHLFGQTPVPPNFRIT